MRSEAWAVWFLDLAAIFIIIHTCTYTNIDWEAYMEQVAMIFDDVVLDYTRILGNTGPLVYPAGFVYIFDFFRGLTDNGRNIRAAQYIFMAVQCALNYAVLSVYDAALPAIEKSLKWRKLQPPYDAARRMLVLLPLIASKRIHSIFVLRLFNDCVAMCLMYWSVKAYSERVWLLGTVFYGIALSVKMNVLLAAPGIALVLLNEIGLKQSMFHFAIVCCWQAAIGMPFLIINARGYISSSFDLSRRFVHRWSVNFQFIPKDLFEIALWGRVLLVFTAAVWAWMARAWLRSAPRKGRMPAHRITATIFFFSLAGVALSRTLHYQFYVWFYHQVPFVLLCTWARRRPVLCAILWAAIEWSFCVYPPTPLSSAVLCSAFAVIAWGIFTSLRQEKFL